MDCDVAVIGSGFGGSVCACRAAQAGLRVIVLERGRRMDARAYEDLAAGQTPLIHRRNTPGLIKPQRIGGLVVLTGSAVGGGSHLYTGVTIRAPDEVFARHWPDSLTPRSLDPYYDRVEAMILPRPIPDPPARSQALIEITDKLGGRGVLLPLAFDFEHGHSHDNLPATMRGEVVRLLCGGQRGGKRTVDMHYLAAAESSGAVVSPQHEARLIEPMPGGFRIGLRRWEHGNVFELSITCRRLVIAAGTLGSLRLLFACRDEHRTLPKITPSLGDRFFTNGDTGAALVWPRRALESDNGPLVTAWADWWRQDRLFLMETNHFCGGRFWSFGVMGFDENPGRIARAANGKLRFSQGPNRGAHFDAARMSRLRQLADALGARLLAPPRPLRSRLQVTVHPLGGAAMSDSPATGVVNSDGEVYGYPGLFIADGSIVPTPTGVAPSMTIAALAERIAERVIRDA